MRSVASYGLIETNNDALRVFCKKQGTERKYQIVYERIYNRKGMKGKGKLVDLYT